MQPKYLNEFCFANRAAIVLVEIGNHPLQPCCLPKQLATQSPELLPICTCLRNAITAATRKVCECGRAQTGEMLVQPIFIDILETWHFLAPTVWLQPPKRNFNFLPLQCPTSTKGRAMLIETLRAVPHSGDSPASEHGGRFFNLGTLKSQSKDELLIQPPSHQHPTQASSRPK